MSQTTVDNITYYRDDQNGKKCAALEALRGSLGVIVVQNGNSRVEIDLKKAIEDAEQIRRDSRAS